MIVYVFELSVASMAAGGAYGAQMKTSGGYRWDLSMG